MSHYRVQFTGLDEVDALLKRISEGKGFKRGLLAWGQMIKSRAQIYPPKSGRPGDTYKRGIDPRSERLGQRWSVDVSRGGSTVTVGNNASYADKVHGDAQPWYHRQTGWKKLDQIATDVAAGGARVLDSYVEKDL